jgi:hypothetical protein
MLEIVFENKYIYTIITIFVILYASQIGPKLPQYMMKLFDNNLFKIAFLFLILVRANKDPAFSLILGVAFVMISNYVRNQLMRESFGEQTESVIVNTDGVLSLNPEKCNEARIELNNIDNEIANLRVTCRDKISLESLKQTCYDEVDKMVEKREKYNELITTTCPLSQPLIVSN